ncbi:hypothetical protein ELS24_20940 [Achromobacter spanius]|uniref:hypothetical protein n=1 Tax=Achromobacter spanius TaxID=217203 RepID=UPI000F8FA14B|nr:hypothetical protein [Achromobacter spanius]AZS80698.1 hypothetical protein ELS24_20940 [Achromobacter spanius]
MKKIKIYTPGEVSAHIEFLREHDATVRRALDSCAANGSPTFGSLHSATADMLEGLLTQLQQAWCAMKGVTYEPICDLADALGISADTLAHFLIGLGLATGTPDRHTPTLLGARLSTPDGLWDSRLHDVIAAQLVAWGTKNQAENEAIERLRRIADAESRNGGAA